MGNGSFKSAQNVPMNTPIVDPSDNNNNVINLNNKASLPAVQHSINAPAAAPHQMVNTRNNSSFDDERSNTLNSNSFHRKDTDYTLDGGAAADDEDLSPIPRRQQNKTRQLAPLDAILGKEGSAAKYIKKRPIGKGAFGEAYIVERNPLYNASHFPLAERQFETNALAHLTIPGGLYVAKVMDLRSMPQQDRQYAQSEIICLAHTQHFGIIKYYEHYVLDSGDETMVIVTEFADHGDLRGNFTRQSVAPDGTSLVQCGLRLSEREAGLYFVQLLLALNHIHSRRMIHRDVKSANLFLTSHGMLKLGDFGFSQKYESTVSSETIAGTFLGTPYYLSPEMWKGMRYGKKADVWAAGIVLYEMLMDGARPFEGMNLTELKNDVLLKNPVLPEFPPDHGAAEGDKGCKRGKFTTEMRELVQAVLQKDPQKRPSAAELLGTPIMQHFLFLFQKHVANLVENDSKATQESVVGLAFPLEADRQLVMRGLEEGQESVKREMQKDPKDTAAARYEGVVYKGNRDGSWKERYLSLSDNALTISLSRNKEAADGGERSKKVPMALIRAINRCQSVDPHVQPVTTAAEAQSKGYTPPYSFVLFMTESSTPIYFGVQTAEELDQWMGVLMRSLNID